MTVIADYDPLYQEIGYRFEDTRLLDLALTHRSAGGKNNERLEFLGDSILNFIIAADLFERYPNATEGELSRQRASFVKKETLAKLGHEFDIGSYLRLGSGEMKSGGFRRESILANALEAIIGAVYLDAGYDVCRDCVVGWFLDMLKSDIEVASQKDPKTQLQETLQAHQHPLPEYNVLSIEGEAHDQLFKVECKVALLDEPTQGEGGSRRKAEQNAALNALTAIEKQAELT